MKSSVLAFVTAAVLTSAAALAQQTSGATSNGSNHSSNHYQTDTQHAATSSSGTNSNANADTNHTDQKFLKDFAEANASEVAAGQLAEQKAQNSDVKAFGKHMVDDHSKANAQLETLANKYDVNVKEKPDLMHKAKTAMLEKKEGAKFDQAYIDAQVTDHQKTIDLLNKEIQNGQDPSVKQLAEKTLPEVKHHLDMAKQLQAQVSSGKNTSNRTSMRKTEKSEKSSS